MANTSRYAPEGPWHIEAVLSRPGVSLAATITVADLVERSSGFRYRDGAWKVTFARKPFDDDHVVTVPRAKSFYGEMAWCNSRRYAEDELLKIERASW